MRVQWILVSVYMRVQWTLVVSVYEGPVVISSQCI